MIPRLSGETQEQVRASEGHFAFCRSLRALKLLNRGGLGKPSSSTFSFPCPLEGSCEPAWSVSLRDDDDKLGGVGGGGRTW